MYYLARAIIAVLITCLLQLPISGVANARGVDKNQALNAVKRKYPGKVIKITNAKNHYQVRLLQKNGRVVNVNVDKKSGKIVKSRKRKNKGR
ncbi:MAG: putative membrane protein YkoI [Phenylobacterium sp.]|jgi:uncharacterized membrane protein YkoI